MDRPSGPSVRLKLTLSYAGFLFVAGAFMFVAAWFAGHDPQSFDFVLRLVPGQVVSAVGVLIPGNQSFLLRAFAPAAVIALVFLLAVGLLGGWLLAGRMLAPLARITDATRMAADGSLSHRIRLPGSQDEFRELADTFDAMLDRLEAHVAEQQRFAANASHELRTPLAVTQTLLEVARKDPAADRDTELLDRLHAVNSRAIDLTEALLLLSRADRRTFVREPVDLSLVVEEAIETVLPVAEDSGTTIDTSGTAAVTSGSYPLLLQLATNLVHNAIVHNQPGGCVWVSTGCEAGHAVLTVENTGDRLSPQLVPTLVEPFHRGSRRIRTQHAGVGLGLAIVKSITEAHGGTLTLVPRDEGGLRVTVRLPAAGT